MKLGEPEATLARSLEELERNMQANREAWGLGTSDRWDADLDSGEIWFTFADGLVVSAPVQVVGSHNLDDGSWLWAWANPSIPPELTEHAQLARSFGERHELPDFTKAMITCSQDDAVRLAALASHLGKATGSYRGPAGSTYVYFSFGPLSFHKSN
jgi:hypothetical protein